MSDAIFRLRVGYAKQGRLRYLGHLELLRTIERCIRRARLPFAVTQGFSPHMRVQFSSALPTGVASTCECYDAFLTSLVDPREALGSLARATPADIVPFGVAYVTREVPALESWLTRARWDVVLPGRAADATAIDAALNEIVAEGEFTYMRGDKPKHADLGTTLVSHAVGTSAGDLAIALDTRSGPTGALRPGALVKAASERAGIADAVPTITRVGQWHEDEDGTLVSPFPASVEWPS